MRGIVVGMCGRGLVGAAHHAAVATVAHAAAGAVAHAAAAADAGAAFASAVAHARSAAVAAAAMKAASKGLDAGFLLDLGAHGVTFRVHGGAQLGDVTDEGLDVRLLGLAGAAQGLQLGLLGPDLLAQLDELDVVLVHDLLDRSLLLRGQGGLVVAGAGALASGHGEGRHGNQGQNGEGDDDALVHGMLLNIVFALLEVSGPFQAAFRSVLRTYKHAPCQNL
ncbi:MAG: hypothetical protein CVU73_08235 [Deltaproteobacteria bacterium HGW-Deltaproteobacteria-8]|nr:MAG: hypothetical protein CVU73_08235 [Deltaproteobacteria bacterium HGW-Deltaproteobacteria-8]